MFQRVIYFIRSFIHEINIIILHRMLLLIWHYHRTLLTCKIKFRIKNDVNNKIHPYKKNILFSKINCIKIQKIYLKLCITQMCPQYIFNKRNRKRALCNKKN